MNRLRYKLSFLMMLISCLRLSAQTLSVESFRMLENDLTANTYGTMERDQNGDVAALIKMVTSETGFVFDGGMMGIVKTEQKTGEIWIYVPHGLQKITISHQQLGVLRDYYFPVPIEKARTYEMRMLSGRVKTVIEDEFAAQYVIFKLNPTNAVVYIDGNAYTAQNDGTVSQLLSYGQHEYRVELSGFKTDAGVIQVGSEKIVKEVNLSSSMATITIQCAMEEADIYVNDEKKGNGSWTGKLAPALYKVEARREGYQTRVLSLTVHELEEKTVSVPEPVPLYGRLEILSDPIDASVYIDGVESGTTPMLTDELRVGLHELMLRKEGYHDYSTLIAVQDGVVDQITAKLVIGNTTEYTPQTVAPKAEKTETVKPKTEKPKKEKPKKEFFEKTNYYVGWYMYPESGVPKDEFTFYCPMNIQAGVYYKNFNAEFNYSLRMECTDNIYGYRNVNTDINGDGVVDDYDSYYYSYTFNDDKHFSLRLGYGVIPFSRMRITPQIGLMYQGLHSLGDIPSWLFDNISTEKSYVMCATVDLKIEFSVLQNVALFYTPGYNFPFKMGTLASKLNEDEHALSKGLKGLYQNIGVSIFF